MQHWSAVTSFFVFVILHSDIHGLGEEALEQKVEDAATNSSTHASQLVADDLHKIYAVIDSNGDGKLTKLEVQQFWSEARAAKRKEDAEGVVNTHDYGSGNVTLEQVIKEEATEFDADGNPSVDDNILEMFKLADFDGDGHLSRDEHHAFLNPASSKKMMEHLASKDLKSMDANGDGKITLQEYTDLQPLGDEGGHILAKEKFQSLDMNGDRELSVEELESHALSHLDDTHMIAEELMENADANGDGTIDNSEFIRSIDDFQKRHFEAREILNSFVVRKRKVSPLPPVSSMIEFSSLAPLAAIVFLAALYAFRRGRSSQT